MRRIATLITLWFISCVGCGAARQTPRTERDFVETPGVVAFEIKRPNESGQLVHLIGRQFPDPVTVVRGPCHFGQDCFTWPDPQEGMQTVQILDHWEVVLTREKIVTTIVNK